MDVRRPFFVTGMPRSRTAWLSAWLTTETTWCAHDTPLNSFPPLIGQYTGLAGPEVCVSFEDFSSSFPDAPWLVIQRPDALTSFRAVLQQYLDVDDNVLSGWWNERLKLLERVIQGPRTMTVTFEQLDTPEVARSIWEHLLPHKPFDAVRWHLMNNLKIVQENWQRKAKTWPLAP